MGRGGGPGRDARAGEVPSGWIFDDEGKAVAHVLRAPYGIGSYTFEFEQFFEKRDADEPVDDMLFG